MTQPERRDDRAREAGETNAMAGKAAAGIGAGLLAVIGLVARSSIDDAGRVMVRGVAPALGHSADDFGRALVRPGAQFHPPVGSFGDDAARLRPRLPAGAPPTLAPEELGRLNRYMPLYLQQPAATTDDLARGAGKGAASSSQEGGHGGDLLIDVGGELLQQGLPTYQDGDRRNQK